MFDCSCLCVNQGKVEKSESGNLTLLLLVGLPVFPDSPRLEEVIVGDGDLVSTSFFVSTHH